MTPGTLSGDVSPICNVELSHEACQFVGLGDLQALASLLDTTPGALRDITRSADNYVAFTARTGGKLRAVTAPRPRLDEMQRRIHDHLATLRPPDYLHSGIRGRSHVTHAASHRCGQWLCKLDLRHFFFQVTTARVQRFFQDRMRCAADVAALLALDDPAIGVDALLALQGRLAAAASIDERYRSRLNATKARLRTLREARSPTGDMAIAAR